VVVNKSKAGGPWYRKNICRYFTYTQYTSAVSLSKCSPSISHHWHISL